LRRPKISRASYGKAGTATFEHRSTQHTSTQTQRNGEPSRETLAAFACGRGYAAAIASKTSGDQIIGASASTNIDPGCGGTYQITVGIERAQKTRLVEAGIWLNPL
jgi:hypothetical protein